MALWQILLISYLAMFVLFIFELMNAGELIDGEIYDKKSSKKYWEEQAKFKEEFEKELSNQENKEDNNKENENK